MRETLNNNYGVFVTTVVAFTLLFSIVQKLNGITSRGFVSDFLSHCPSRPKMISAVLDVTWSPYTVF